MKVKECMCDDVCCVKPETKIKEVAKLMSENHIGSIPVCDQNQCICGIVTDRDILLRCVACDKDTNQTSVSEIMSCNVCTCKEDDDITIIEDFLDYEKNKFSNKVKKATNFQQDSFYNHGESINELKNRLN